MPSNNSPSRWISFLSILLSCVAILFCIWSHSNDLSNDARLNEIAAAIKLENSFGYDRDSLINQIKIEESKKDFYINQISIQSDWMIFYVSILFAFFAIIGFGVFNDKFEDIRKDYDEFKSENIDKHDNLFSEFKKHESALIHELINYKTASNHEYLKFKSDFESEFKALSIQQLELAAVLCQMEMITTFNNNKHYDFLILTLSFIGYKAKANDMGNNMNQRIEIIDDCAKALGGCYTMLEMVKSNLKHKKTFLAEMKYDYLSMLLNDLLTRNIQEFREPIFKIITVLNSIVAK